MDAVTVKIGSVMRDTPAQLLPSALTKLQCGTHRPDDFGRFMIENGWGNKTRCQSWVLIDETDTDRDQPDALGSYRKQQNRILCGEGSTFQQFST